MTLDGTNAVDRIRVLFPDAVLACEEQRGETTMVIKKDALAEICTCLRDHPLLLFRFLVDVAAVDYHPAEPRFAVVYHLLSHEHKKRLRLRVLLDGPEAEIASVVPIWPTAEWHEREAFDLMGIRFSGHPDLRRILLPEHWGCFPLRKDYPLEGLGEDAENENALGREKGARDA